MKCIQCNKKIRFWQKFSYWVLGKFLHDDCIEDKLNGR